MNYSSSASDSPPDLIGSPGSTADAIATVPKSLVNNDHHHQQQQHHQCLLESKNHSSFVSATDTESTKAATTSSSLLSDEVVSPAKHYHKGRGSITTIQQRLDKSCVDSTSMDVYNETTSNHYVDVAARDSSHTYSKSSSFTTTLPSQQSEAALTKLVATAVINTIGDGGSTTTDDYYCDISNNNRPAPAKKTSNTSGIVTAGGLPPLPSPAPVMQLPGPPNVALRRERSAEVSSAPPSKPTRRPSHEEISELIPVKTSLPPPPAAATTTDKKKKKKKKSSSRGKKQNIESAVLATATTESNSLDISNHSAPPNIYYRSSSNGSSSKSSYVTRDSTGSLSSVRSRRSIRRTFSDISCGSISSSMSNNNNHRREDLRPTIPLRKQCPAFDEFSLGHIQESPTRSVKVLNKKPDDEKIQPTTSIGNSPLSSMGSGFRRAEDMEAYVMARIPAKVKKRLPAETWREIFQVVAETQAAATSNSSGSNSSSPSSRRPPPNFVQEEGEEETNNKKGAVVDSMMIMMMKKNTVVYSDDDDSSSVISGVTCPSEIRSVVSSDVGSIPTYGYNDVVVVDDDDDIPSGQPVSSPSKNDDLDDDDEIDMMHLSAVPASSSSTMTSRSWGSAAIVESAPRLPQRPPPPAKASTATEQHHCQRRMSAPTPNDSSDLPRGELGNRNKSTEFTLETTASSSLSSTKKVSFDKVHIRRYERILDVNPCTSSGPAIGIGWRHTETESFAIDDVAKHRRNSSTSSSSSSSLNSNVATYGDGDDNNVKGWILSRRVRERMLTELGYSKQEIADAVRQSIRTKNQRKQTYNNLSAGTEKVEYLVEKSRRKVSKILRFGSNKKNAIMEGKF